MYNHNLDTFIQVADCGSFSKAGKALFLSTVSVMNQINSLEKIVDTSLFERTNHGVILTDAGRSLYKDAKKMIRLAEDMTKRAKNASDTSQYTIRIGTSHLRPCKTLIDLWTQADDGSFPFRLKIVPFEDDLGVIDQLFSSPGQAVDCFFGPCDSVHWKHTFRVEPLGYSSVCIAVSKKNPLSIKKVLTIDELAGETIMLIKRGISLVLDKIRDKIEACHPGIQIVEMSNFYNTQVFNECDERGCLMVSLDIWKDVHPSVVTLPVNWDYQTPCGVIYVRDASKPFLKFLDIIKNVKIS